MWPIRTFQRGAERVSLHIREGNRGVTLVVSGDDDLRSYSFRDVPAMMKFEGEMEEFLLYGGWVAMRMVPEHVPDATPGAAHTASLPGRNLVPTKAH